MHSAARTRVDAGEFWSTITFQAWRRPLPTSREILTLVTCYPFYFVGAAPNRFIVRGERIE